MTFLKSGYGALIVAMNENRGIGKTLLDEKLDGKFYSQRLKPANVMVSTAPTRGQVPSEPQVTKEQTYSIFRRSVYPYVRVTSRGEGGDGMRRGYKGQEEFVPPFKIRNDQWMGEMWLEFIGKFSNPLRNGLMKDIPKKTGVLYRVVKGLTHFLMPKNTEMCNEELGITKVIIVVVDFAIGSAEKETSETGRAEDIKVVNPLKTRADMKSIPNVYNSILDFTLKSRSGR
ncbi:hypothetical protein EDD16DRAFT_1523341 [Pisolithus croceorrhizus]|nr:hypothetical protein EV401DRAFT_1893261 [Pisolithus croceorrhizus]KAI6107297.1 hypothetical protein EDD16DRAFT_1523341 [Pisolithus croceorrhizus]KAI6167495.1 hypothetical protein EDD17DRAFT_1504596 [Pisolithus thermaeus]